MDYNVAMQILRYMVYIWEDYEKQQERRIPGVSKLAGFKYPPVFPIVYYNGEGNWTVDASFISRIALSNIFSPHVPEDEVQIFVNQIKERQMSDLFEGFKGINVMEERKIGQNKGEETKLIKMVCKKLSLGQSVEQIALDLIEDEAIVGEISSVAAKYAPDYDVEAIYMDLKTAEKKTL